MNSELIPELRANLDALLRDGQLTNRNVFVFGANAPGDEAIAWLGEKGVAVKAIVDNNPANHGKAMLGVPISMPEQKLQPFDDANVILICSSHYPEMKRQLEGLGYQADAHIIRLLNLCGDNDFTVTEAQFRKHAGLVRRAHAVHDRLLTHYGADAFFFVCPIKAIGDVYLAASFLKHYVEKEGIRNSVMTVSGQACETVARLFSIANVERLSLEESDHLVRLSRFLGESQCRIKVLQPFSVYTGLSRAMQGYRGWTFFDFYKHAVFGLDESVRARVPQFASDSGRWPHNKLKDLCPQGRGALLAPYANSLPRLPFSFWISLAAELDRRGFSVFTNVAGEREAVVPGTRPLDVSFADLESALKWMGCVISIRSGMCELASSVQCRKIIVYPDKACGLGRVLDGYSTKAMDGATDVFEMVYDKDEKQMVDDVLACIAR